MLCEQQREMELLIINGVTDDSNNNSLYLLNFCYVSDTFLRTSFVSVSPSCSRPYLQHTDEGEVPEGE